MERNQAVGADLEDYYLGQVAFGFAMEFGIAAYGALVWAEFHFFGQWVGITFVGASVLIGLPFLMAIIPSFPVAPPEYIPLPPSLKAEILRAQKLEMG